MTRLLRTRAAAALAGAAAALLVLLVVGQPLVEQLPWRGKPADDTSQPEILLPARITALATSPQSETMPVVSGDLVLWRAGRGRDVTVAGRDLATGRTIRLPIAETVGTRVAASGTLVVWPDPSHDCIAVHDLTDGRTRNVAQGCDPQWVAVSGHTVVWEDSRSGAGDIYGCDLRTDRTFPICVHPARQLRPAISGDLVVWEDWRGARSDIYARDLATGRTFVVCDNPATQVQPAVSGTIVVWEDERHGDSDIYAVDLADGQERPICVRAENQSAPAVAGGLIVWQDARDGNQDIYGYDLAGAHEIGICVDPRTQGSPAVDGVVVAWEDRRSGRPDIYLAVLVR